MEPSRSLRVVRLAAVLLFVGLAGGLFWRGRSYYPLPLEARPEHVDFRVLRPSGDLGHAYGYAGAALMLLNLLYLARRRLAGRSLGSMRVWLELHVITGLTAALLVLYHSAFQLRTAIATTTAASLGIVVATGVIGRFLHALAPKGDDRLAMALVDLEAVLPGVGGAVTRALAAAPLPDVDASASLRRCLAAIPAWRRCASYRRDAVRLVAGNHAGLAALDDAARARARRAAAAAGRAAAQEVRATAAAAFLRSWRSLHRFFALLMLLTVGVHIAVAWHYGYRWIFG